MIYTAKDFFGKEFEYQHEVVRVPVGSYEWSYNKFQAKALDGNWYSVRIDGLYPSHRRENYFKYEASLETTKEWFITQLKRSGGILTHAMKDINTYRWVPAAYVRLYKNLEESPHYAGEVKLTAPELMEDIALNEITFVGESDNCKWFVTRLANYYELSVPFINDYGYDTIGFYPKAEMLKIMKLIMKGEFKESDYDKFKFASPF